MIKSSVAVVTAVRHVFDSSNRMDSDLICAHSVIEITNHTGLYWSAKGKKGVILSVRGPLRYLLSLKYACMNAFFYYERFFMIMKAFGFAAAAAARLCHSLSLPNPMFRLGARFVPNCSPISTIYFAFITTHTPCRLNLMHLRVFSKRKIRSYLLVASLRLSFPTIFGVK